VPAETAADVRGRPPLGPEPLEPVPHRIVGCRKETDDVITLSLEVLSGTTPTFAPGQFNMLTAYGVGEAAISVSSSRREADALHHTVRDVGPVSAALCRARPGDVVGVRGPFGTSWGVDEADLATGDVVVVAGGIGLAPLRGAIDELVHRPDPDGGRVFVVTGARDPTQLIFGDDLEAWGRAGAVIAATVDTAMRGWTGHVGLVTSLLGGIDCDPGTTTALVCGPEIMMRFAAKVLVDRGIDPQRIKLSMERNMQCGLGWCGHCQLGPFLLCRDGPVVTYTGEVARLISERER